MDKGSRSIEMLVVNNSDSTIRMSKLRASGSDWGWIDGEEPNVGGTIDSSCSKQYGMYNSGGDLAFGLTFEGIGNVKLSTSLVGTQPYFGYTVDEGINVDGSQKPSNDDPMHPLYTITISGKATGITIYRSIKITVTNNAKGVISVSSANVRGTRTSWLEGDQPQIGASIDINSSATYGVSTPVNFAVGFDVAFEGIGWVELDPSVNTNNKASCAHEEDTGITVTGTDAPSNNDPQNPEYAITISGNATSRSIGLSAEEMKKAST